MAIKTTKEDVAWDIVHFSNGLFYFASLEDEYHVRRKVEEEM